MTIELTLEDLEYLIETVRKNGHSVEYITRATDGKRVHLAIAHEARRKHRARAAQAQPKEE